MGIIRNTRTQVSNILVEVPVCHFLQIQSNIFEGSIVRIQFDIENARRDAKLHVFHNKRNYSLSLLWNFGIYLFISTVN